MDAKECACGVVHKCMLCPPDEARSIKLAARWGLDFTLVMLHKGHYVKLRSNDEMGGAAPRTIKLWHALYMATQQLGMAMGGHMVAPVD